MGILDNLHPNLQFFIGNPKIKKLSSPVSQGDLEELLSQFPNTPPDFIEIIKIHDGVIIGGNGLLEHFELTVFSAEEAILVPTQWYKLLPVLLPNVFFFAQNGDYVFFFSEDEDSKKMGVFKVEFGASDWSEVEYMGHSIEAVLCGGSGWDVLPF